MEKLLYRFFLFLGIISLFCTRITLSKNKGLDCAACTIFFTAVYEFSKYHNMPYREALNTLVTYIPPDYRADFAQGNLMFGSIIAAQLETGDNPDTICQRVELCADEYGSCHLFPIPPPKTNPETSGNNIFSINAMSLKNVEFCKLPMFGNICTEVEKSYYLRHPVIDNDDDGFSTEETRRGHAWRGKDCNDNDFNIRPGLIANDGDRKYDSNCNGIWGVNPETGYSYEDELCKNSGPRGLINVGDSIGAMFHIPIEWLDCTKFEQGIFDNATYVIRNAADWPQLSYGTGHQNTSWKIVLQENLTTDSIYWRMRNRNLCNNNDYHNLAFNGGNSENILKEVNFTKIRHQLQDKPATVIYALYGNDVCNREKDTLAAMTKPEDFRTNVRTFYERMDNILPPGSCMLSIGLIEGQYLYSTLKDRIHPVGSVTKDVLYYDLYEWMSCVDVIPCRGWMSSNETLRNITTERANELSAIMEEVSKEKEYKNFKIHYLRLSVMDVIGEYKDKMDMFIEPALNYHPNRRAHSFIAKHLWKHVETHFPECIGDINPNNERIQKLFNLNNIEN